MIGFYFQVLASAFVLGFVAAAPIGPVNTVAIHRGAMGRWTHTLFTGLGSVLVDLSYFAIILLGGSKLLEYLEEPSRRQPLTIVGGSVLMIAGAYFVYKSFRYDLRGLARYRRTLRMRPSTHLWTDAGRGALLTIINPAAPIYWLGVTAPWLNQIPHDYRPALIVWGLLAAASGLTGWFAILTVLVRFMPQKLGPRFFRVVSMSCGVLLGVFGLLCLTGTLNRH